jgi:hypothetical protein
MFSRRRWERPIAHAAMEEEMLRLRARFDAMETTQRIALEFGNVSEAKSEDVEAEEVVGEQVAEERLLRVVVKLGTREKMEVPMYEGNLNVEELFD